MSAFAAFAVVGFGIAYIGPLGASLSSKANAEVNEPVTLYASTVDDAQSLTVNAAVDEKPTDLGRDSYSVYVKPKPKPKPTVSAAKQSSSSSAESAVSRLVYTGGGSPAQWMAAAGIAQSDWGYVDYIVKRESGWNPNATNRSSGACGLVQALPCSKVPGNGYNPVDNLRWGSGYASGRYGGWAGAYAFWVSHNWW
jgi:soluble lytic murein transglycosylase-like protein